MSGLYKNKYRTDSLRLPHWDYGWNGAYFVTICTLDKNCHFGNVSNGEMALNEIGLIARNLWMEIADRFPFVELGEYIVMPNHIHGIIIIDKPDGDEVTPAVETRLIASLQQALPTHSGGATGRKNPMLHDNLFRVIRWYKGRTTFESRKVLPDFAWQPRFYDHIIRNDKSFQRISDYIIDNPLNWAKDRFYR
ncbi:MAG: transposase [Cyclobacteriaceae bacterium]